jgi:hypothetical protein
MTINHMSIIKKTIGAGEFKKNCLQIFNDIQNKEYTVVITKYKRPVAEIGPIHAKEQTPIFGLMKGTVTEFGDITEPVDEAWDAERGL